MRLFVGKLQVTSSIFLCNLYSSASLLICPVADNSAVFVQLFCAFFVGICHKSHVNHVVDHDLRTAGKNAVFLEKRQRLRLVAAQLKQGKRSEYIC